MRVYRQLLREPRFAALCAGQVVSLLGDALFPILVVVAAAQAGTAAETIGAVFTARFISLGAIVLFSGSLLDRMNPVRAAVVADSLRVVALLVLAVAWDGRLDALVLVAAFSPNLGAALAAATFAVSAIATRWAGARWVRGPSRPGPDPEAGAAPEKAGGASESLVRSAVAGLATLWQIRWLRNVELLAIVHVVIAVGPWMLALPVAILAGGGTVVQYGWLLGAFAGGAVVGALLGGRIRGGHPGL